MLFGRLFPTDLGWIGFLRDSEYLLQRVKIGFAEQMDLVQEIGSKVDFDVNPDSVFDDRVEQALIRFAAGERIEFDEFDIDESWMTPFQKAVVEHCRAIPFGETTSYGELAENAGSPNAGRAVGSVMAKNRFPILVPCHRVLATGKKLGGFSAPRGVSLKIKMLQLEANACAREWPISESQLDRDSRWESTLKSES